MQTNSSVYSPADHTDFKRLDTIVAEHRGAFIACGQALMEIKQRDLWRFRYASWDAYCKARVGWSGRRANQIISATETTAVIQQRVGTEVPAPTSEAQVRVLTSLEPEQAASAWATTVQAYGDTPTGQQVRSTVQRIAGTYAVPEDPDAAIKRLVISAGHQPVIDRMTTGTLTPKQALTLSDALDQVDVQVCRDVLRLNLDDPKIIRELNRLYGQKSESYGEVIAAGCLQFEREAIVLQKATVRDIRRWLDWKYSEHRRHAFASKLVRERQEATVIAADDGTLTLRLPGIQHELAAGERVVVTIVRK